MMYSYTHTLQHDVIDITIDSFRAIFVVSGEWNWNWIQCEVLMSHGT